MFQAQCDAGWHFPRGPIREGHAIKILREPLPTAPRLNLLESLRRRLESAVR